jgi:glycosyltransferase involved in cell wall biosynthesis
MSSPVRQPLTRPWIGTRAIRGFLQRHQDRLQQHYEPNKKNILPARDAIRQRRRVLFIEDRVPHPALGSGFPRSNAILSILAKSGCFITLYPTAVIAEEWCEVYSDIPREVEVMLGYGPDRLQPFLASRIGYYDLMLISRPHNMQFAKPILHAHRDWFRNTRIIYDAEALFAVRELASLRLMGAELDTKSVEQLTISEVELAAQANIVVSVSKLEAAEFSRLGVGNVRVLGHSIAVAPTPRAFEERGGFLFVGSLLEEKSPNGDAVLWFTREILPLIQQSLGPVPFTIAGVNKIDLSSSPAASQLRILGKVPDLSAIYDEARVFVAPTRFAAGIPLKIYEAAARGVPAVATSLLMRQLGWVEDTHLLIADEPRAFAEQCVRLYSDASLWERIRRDALHQVRIDCSPEAFETTLESILEG